jgi:hypothetical protein
MLVRLWICYARAKNASGIAIDGYWYQHVSSAWEFKSCSLERVAALIPVHNNSGRLSFCSRERLLALRGVDMPAMR